MTPANPPPAAPSGARLGALLVLAAGVVLLARSALAGAWDGGRAPFPFAWRDVALVQLLCALPLAVTVTAMVNRRPPGARAALAAAALAAGLVEFTDAARSALAPAIASEPPQGLVIRALPAVFLALSAGLVVSVLRGIPPGEGPRARRAVLALAAVVAVGVPGTFAGARARHDAERLGEFVAQSRFGEARALADGLLLLDARREVGGRPVPEVAADVERVIAGLEARVAAPLPRGADVPARYERARALAMLGRTAEALAVLAPVDDPDAAPAVDNLRGTIRETRGEWDEALACYERARAGWEPRPPVPARAPELRRAEAGIAYCLRKSGRSAEAEAAYQRLLAVDPTAETHFLLAQFYEDAQQAGKAREHARAAVALAPDRYRQKGEKLIARLSMYQFGCLGVFFAEGGPATANGIPPQSGGP